MLLLLLAWSYSPLWRAGKGSEMLAASSTCPLVHSSLGTKAGPLRVVLLLLNCGAEGQRSRRCLQNENCFRPRNSLEGSGLPLYV